MGTRIIRSPEQYKFDTLDFDVQILDKNFSSLGSKDVRFVVVHHMTIDDKDTNTPDALDACYRVWQIRPASAQYGVDDHFIRQFVWDKDYAWAAGNTYANLHGIHIEHANDTLDLSGTENDYKITEKTWKTGAKLAAYIHIFYKLGRPTSTGFGSGGTLRTHQSFYATACPGPFFKKIWTQYVAETQRIYDLVKSGGITPPVVTPPPAPVALWGKPETWVLGAKSADVLRLGQLINVWNKAVGLPTFVPDDIFSTTEVKALSALQSQIWGFGNTAADLAKGGNSDGYPGLQSFDKVASTPPAPTIPEVPVTKLSILHWNVAGSDMTNGYNAENSWRGPYLGRYALALGFDVLMTCEASQDDLRNGISVGLGVIGDTEWEERAKAIWYAKSRGIINVSSRRAFSDDTYDYQDTLKWGGAFFGMKDGKRFSVLEVHTDYRAPALQAKQLQAIFKKWRVVTDQLEIKHVNTFVVGDLNWDGSSGDNPFRALDAWNFHEKGSRTEFTFMERKHLDGVLAHRDSVVTVDVKPRSHNGRKLSDHNPVKAVAILQ